MNIWLINTNVFILGTLHNRRCHMCLEETLVYNYVWHSNYRIIYSFLLICSLQLVFFEVKWISSRGALCPFDSLSAASWQHPAAVVVCDHLYIPLCSSAITITLPSLHTESCRADIKGINLQPWSFNQLLYTCLRRLRLFGCLLGQNDMDKHSVSLFTKYSNNHYCMLHLTVGPSAGLQSIVSTWQDIP